MVWLLIPAALIVLIAVVLARTLTFRPKENVRADETEVQVNREAVVLAFSQRKHKTPLLLKLRNSS